MDEACISGFSLRRWTHTSETEGGSSGLVSQLGMVVPLPPQGDVLSQNSPHPPSFPCTHQ